MPTIHAGAQAMTATLPPAPSENICRQSGIAGDALDLCFTQFRTENRFQLPLDLP
jgi:hypothetical protein